MNNSGGILLLYLRDKPLEKHLTLSVAPLHQMDKNKGNQRLLGVAFFWHITHLPMPIPGQYTRHMAHGKNGNNHNQHIFWTKLTMILGRNKGENLLS